MRSLKAIAVAIIVLASLVALYKATRPSDEELCLQRARSLIGAIEMMQLSDGSIGALTLIQDYPGDVAIRSFNQSNQDLVKDFLNYLVSRHNALCPSGGCYKVIGGNLFCSKHGHFIDNEKFLKPEELKDGVVKGNPTIYWGNSFCIVDSGKDVSIHTRQFSWDLAPKAGGDVVHIIRNNDRVLLVMREQSLDVTDHPAREEMLKKIKYSFD